MVIGQQCGQSKTTDISLHDAYMPISFLVEQIQSVHRIRPNLLFPYMHIHGLHHFYCNNQNCYLADVKKTTLERKRNRWFYIFRY